MWLWLAASLAPLYMALTLAAAAAAVWPAGAPPFFHQPLLALGPWLPGVESWRTVIDLRETFMDGRFQTFMPVLLALLGCGAFALMHAWASHQRYKELRRKKDKESLMV
jgi:hypothetical protein